MGGRHRLRRGRDLGAPRRRGRLHVVARDARGGDRGAHEADLDQHRGDPRAAARPDPSRGAARDGRARRRRPFEPRRRHGLPARGVRDGRRRPHGARPAVRRVRRRAAPGLDGQGVHVAGADGARDPGAAVAAGHADRRLDAEGGAPRGPRSAIRTSRASITRPVPPKGSTAASSCSPAVRGSYT